MTKEEIIKYITLSPENTNPNVLEGMLDEMGGSLTPEEENWLNIKNEMDENNQIP